MKNAPNVHIRLSDKQLWNRIRAQAVLEGVHVGVIVERALTEWLSDPAAQKALLKPKRVNAHV
jgi:hypothetical protein